MGLPSTVRRAVQTRLFQTRLTAVGSQGEIRTLLQMLGGLARASFLPLCDSGEWLEEPCPPATEGMCLVYASAGSVPVNALIFLYDSSIDTGNASNAELCAELGGIFYP